MSVAKSKGSNTKPKPQALTLKQRWSQSLHQNPEPKVPRKGRVTKRCICGNGPQQYYRTKWLERGRIWSVLQHSAISAVYMYSIDMNFNLEPAWKWIFIGPQVSFVLFYIVTVLVFGTYLYRKGNSIKCVLRGCFYAAYSVTCNPPSRAWIPSDGSERNTMSIDDTEVNNDFGLLAQALIIAMLMALPFAFFVTPVYILPTVLLLTQPMSFVRRGYLWTFLFIMIGYAYLFALITTFS